MKRLTEKEYKQRALMEMRFKHYYKYTFTYEGDCFKGKKVIVKCECSDDIYRTEFVDMERLGTFGIDDCYWG